MKNPSLKIVFAGTPKLGAVILEELVRSGFKIPLVLTKSDKPAGRGKKILPTSVKLVAKKNNITILSPIKLDQEDFVKQLKKLSPDLIVVAAYGKILPKVIIDLPKYGVLNVHPSLLPKYRGPSPIQFTILEGETKTGVTIIKMSESLDEGDILTQVEVSISPDDTTQSLTDKLAKIGAELIIQTIPKWINGKIKPQPQDHLKATYSAMLTKYDGKIDLENPPTAEKFNKMVRAFYPWPGVWTELRINNQVLRIKFLPNNPFLIQLEGKRPMSSSQCKNDYPEIFHQISHLLEHKLSPE